MTFFKVQNARLKSNGKKNIRAGGRTGQAGAGCLVGPAGLGGKILKYSYLLNLKHFQDGISIKSHF